ncbi:MAG: S8 family peptidase, partial [Anaerolineae bacterium]
MLKPKSYRLLFSLLIAASVLLAGVLLVSAAPPAPAASKLTATPLTIVDTLSPDGNAEPWPYIVRLAGDPLATYRGGVARLQATSPRVTQQAKLNVKSPASRAYLDYLTNRQAQFTVQLTQVVGHPVEVLHTYKVAYNGLAVVLTPAEAARVAQIPGVVSVHRDEMKQILTDVTPDFIGATAVWDATAAGVDTGTKGEGVIVGVVDTGIWPEHPSFADDGTYPAPPQDWGGECTPPADDTADYTCNNKLIGVQYFLDGYDEVVGFDGLFFSGRDDDGHGTHTASTSAGNENVEATLLGIDRGTVSGIAPRAHVASYRACGPGGCVGSDLVAAIDKAVADGVDVINYSIGGGASDPWDDEDSLAFLAAREAGIFVATSAGNSGPDPDTIGSPANSPWVTTVGASTSTRHFISEITLSATDTAPVTLFGASVTDGVTDFNLVDAEGIADSEGDDSGLCLNPFPEGTFQPTDVVLCKRGQIARVARGAYVQAGGGGGVILYNPVQQGLATDNYVIPAVHVENDVGQQIKDYIAANPEGVTVSFTPGTATFGPEDPRVIPDMMASFSSRGPNGPVPAVIKPDVTAPGVQILAGASPEHTTELGDAQGELFQSIQGTSMSSPHVAGAGALLMAVHPDWSPAEVQSALMTTGLTEVVKEDGETAADPFDLGGGRIDLTQAADPGLVFDMSVADYEAGQDDPANMNLPSLGFGDVAGVATITRTATSLVGVDSTWTITVDAPDGVQITVSPDPLVAPANGTATFTVSVDATEAPEGQYFAHVYLEHGPHQVHMPVAFVNVPAVWNSLAGVKTQFDVSSTDFNLQSGVNVDPFAINAYGLVDPVRTAGGPLDQDPDQDASTDPMGEGFELYPYTLTSDVLWFVVQTRESEINDIDLYLLYDADTSGTFEWPGELIDADTSGDANEEVEAVMPQAGDYLVAVHAWAGSGAYTLKTYQVTTADDTLTLIDAPASIEAANNYAMQVAWDRQIDQGEEYLGAITMGDSEDATAVGFVPVRIIGDVPAVQKSVSSDAVFTGDSLDYEIVVANADVQERQMDLSDAIPSNVTVDPASITGGATLDGSTITWSGTLPAASNS